MRKVEEALQAKGFDPGPINGQMDAQTQQALRDYQSKNKLPVTGTVDQATAESLDVVIVIAGMTTAKLGMFLFRRSA